MPKKQNSQFKYRNKKFSFDQYWKLDYTEYDSKGNELDFQVVIKARSADLAKKILTKKVKEDNPSHKIKALQIFMFAHDTALANLRLNIKDWQCIRNASFPNFANHLFKYNKPRPKGYNNRFNKGTPPKKSLGFQKGNKIRPIHTAKKEEKPYMLWRGKWVEWPKEEREAMKEKIQLHLSLNGNNRTRAAKSMGIPIRSLYKLMEKKFVEVDWQKEFPPPPPRIAHALANNERRIAGIKSTWQKKSEARIARLAPQALKMRLEGATFHMIREKLKCNYQTVKKCLNYGN